jgi:hypothetical protein
MSHRAARVIVFLLAVTCVAAAAYLLATTETRIVAERSAEHVAEGQAHEAALLLERLRTAQQSYVAEGQGPDYWMTRVADTHAMLERTLAGLAANASADRARVAAARATDLLGQHRRLDERARAYIGEGQRLMASDVIFTESSGTVAEIARAVDQARTEQRTASDARIGDLARQQVYVLAAAAAIVLVLALLLIAPARPAPPQDTRQALRALMNEGAPAGGVLLRPDRAAPPPPSAPPAPPVRIEEAAGPEPSSTPGSVASGVDLSATARLCAELARVGDASDLPPLLERAALVLGASGLIVWVADRSGASLFPLLAHGYPPKVLARMGSIARGADNAAAAAYRHGDIRTVPAQGTLPGALVAPIITAQGCVGVLAVEMRNGGERNDTAQAVAAIVAAQLATFVTAVPTAQETE